MILIAHMWTELHHSILVDFEHVWFDLNDLKKFILWAELNDVWKMMICNGVCLLSENE